MQISPVNPSIDITLFEQVIQPHNFIAVHHNAHCKVYFVLQMLLHTVKTKITFV